MKTKRTIAYYKSPIILAMVLFLAGGLFASPDIFVDLRLYQGARETKQEKPTVVTSYYIKPLFSGSILLDIDLSQEKKEIQKVFNLKDIKLTSQANWGWKKGVPEKQFQLIVLGGRKYIVQLTLLDEEDHFQLEVIEKRDDNKKQVLETKILLSQEKTVVFGFEDSAGNPFFLSFQRHKDKMVDTGQAPLKIESIQKPRLIRKIKPVYPKEALRNMVQGKVIMEAVTDVYGRVAEVGKVSGHPLLIKAAMDAMKQWVYEPYILDKKPRAVRFTVVVNFNLNNKEKEDGEKESAAPVKLPSPHKPKLIKKIPPQYPKEAIKSQIQGKVMVEAMVDKEGNVVTIENVSGHPILADAAVVAVKQWKYQPYKVGGVVKSVRFTVIVDFNLNKKKKK